MSISSHRIQELPESERPREKLSLRGAGSLTDAEILALFFGSGRPGKSAIDMGREMIEQFGSLQGISRCAMRQLMEIDGVGPAKATQLAAVFEFGKRLAQERYDTAPLDHSGAIYDLMANQMQSLPYESLRVVLLNVKNRLILVDEITRGTASETLAHPREVLKPAILHGATGFTLVHNHPSGDPAPSQADMRITKKIQEAARSMEIGFYDHVIIGLPGDGNELPYFSFCDAGLI